MMSVSTAGALPPPIDLGLLHDATDLTAAGHSQYFAFRPIQQRTWRHCNPHDGRPMRRVRHDADAKDDGKTTCFSSTNVWERFTRYCLCCSGRSNTVGGETFYFTSGLQGFFQWVVREHPFIAMCVWAFLFLCEGAMVVLYMVQTMRPGHVTWLEYEEENFGFFTYAQTTLSVVLLSQLFFAYSVSPITIIIVLVTSGNRIITFILALTPGGEWASRVYIPLFLRCWPMRQYFLFLLDAFAMIRPRSRRLGIIRHAAGPLSAFLALVITCGCTFHIHQVFRGFPLSIIDAHYWLMVTVSTVGFGDIVPHGPDGVALAIVFIFTFLACMPLWIGVIMSTLQLLRSFPSYEGRGRHFIVCGDVTREEAISILEEVIALHRTISVCFCNTSFPHDVVTIARHPRYRLRSTFLEIDVLNSRALERMRAQEAEAIIVLPTSRGVYTMRDDDVMLPCVVFQRGAPRVPLYLRLRFGCHLDLLHDRRRTMVDHQMRRVLATALLLPGIVPFLVNLVRTSSMCGVSPATLWDEKGMDNWKALYEYSCRNVFNSCTVPTYLANLTLGRIVVMLKQHGVLVVGVEEKARRLVRLNLDYCVEIGDKLLLLHEQGSDVLDNALKNLNPLRAYNMHMSRNNEKKTRNKPQEASAKTALSTSGITSDVQVELNQYSGSSEGEVGEEEEEEEEEGHEPLQNTCAPSSKVTAVVVNDSDGVHNGGLFTDISGGKNADEYRVSDEMHSKLFYPFNSSFDMADREMILNSPPLSSSAPAAYPAYMQQVERHSRIRRNRAAQVESLRKRLLGEPFVDKMPCSVPLQQLPLGGPMPLLLELLDSHHAARAEPTTPEDVVGRLETQLNNILVHLAGEYLQRKKHGGSGGGGGGGGKSGRNAQKMEEIESFLFVDQVSSFKQPPGQSLYDEELNETRERLSLTQMVQCIRSIYKESRVTVLTSQPMSIPFMEYWARTLGTPLRYIRGVSTMESHLEYALRQGGGISKLRGILVYCSQMGNRDFEDVPLVTVVNNLRMLIESKALEEANERNANGRTERGRNRAARVTSEQHLLVEMQCFSSCIFVSPYHTDVEWRRRGEENFQYSLAFMCGRCFSTNMLQTIFIHAHYNEHILPFFDMVLNINKNSPNHDTFDDSGPPPPTLFHLCGNQLLHFQTFGDAFRYLLTRRSWVAIGVFRKFPPSEKLPGIPRYFITNPSLKMPLRADDVMYAISDMSSRYNQN